MEHEKIRIGFIGYGTRALDALMEHPLFEVRYFLAPKARLCEEVYDAARRYEKQLTMEIVADNEELAKCFGEIRDVDCFLMNACPIILNQKVLERMRVFNIHPGDLHYNRGHQPHMWTVLLGEQETKIVLHTVGTAIDAGFVIKSVRIPVQVQDNAEDVLNHAEDKIPLLLDALYAYLREGASYEEEVMEGGYRRIMDYRDYEIVAGDSVETMERKIRARSMNHGAFLQWNGKRVYVDSVIKWKKEEKETSWQIEIQGEMVRLQTGRQSIWFHINKVE